jgi:Carboxypeptidase regulatory-like domain
MSAYRTCKLKLASAALAAIWSAFSGAPSICAQTTGTIKGQVTDATGSAIPGADVAINSGKTVAKKAQTDETGSFNVTGLAPGNYTVSITKFGFANYSTKTVAVGAGKIQTVAIPLELQASKQEVTVQSDVVGTVSVDPSANASQLVLKGTDLDALPDDPDDLAADLQALAGPSAGPNGGQIYIDGFTGGNLPPKSSIREIRINQNPFSAEYDRLGFGRIEILTKPGTDRYRGNLNFNDSDGIFNSRNPYLTGGNTTPDFQSKYYGGNFAGPLSKKASFFFDFNRREIDDNAIINATILNPVTLTPMPYSNAVPTPNRNTEGSLRLDYQLNTNNTLVARYSFQEARQENAGIGTFSLPSTGYTTVNPEHRLQLTETMVLGAKVVNETRFQFLNDRSTQDGPNGVPALVVSQSFTGGGAQVGRSWDTQRHYETQNYTSIAQGTHAIKFGARVRTVGDDNNSESNFGGTFTFAGISSAAVLGSNNLPVTPGLNCALASNAGNPSCTQINSLESYRRALVLPGLGFTPTQVCLYGGCPYQFSIVEGQPYLHVNSTDVGFFLMDDWRFRPNLTLSFGIRYEVQNHLDNYNNVAPRFGFAWSPGAGKTGRSKTVIRGGAGLFYDRFQLTNILNAERFNGTTQVSYVITNPTFFPNVPTSSQLQQLIAAQTSTTSTNQTTRYVVDPNLRTPMVLQSSIAVERQLPFNSTLSVNFLDTHESHFFRTVNINAPLEGTFMPGVPGSGEYPYGASSGGIYQYQSTGVLNQNQLITSVSSRVNSNISFTTFYIFAHANSNSDGINTFPSNSYDWRSDYGPSALDVRNRFVLIGSILTKYGIRVSPTIFAQTGTPFNITVGQDLNGDLQLNDRPAFAPASACGTNNQYIKCTKYGDFNLNPVAGDTIIPRNYGRAPGSFTANLRVSKTWGFGEVTTRAPRGQGGGPGGRGGGMPPGMGMGGPGGGGPGGGGGGRGGGGMGGMGGGGGDMTNKRYNLTFSVEARNILNHVNPGPPIGNLLSPQFGESNSLSNAGGPPGGQTNNRRITLGLRFAF